MKKIDVINLSKSYHGVYVLRNVTLTIEEGKTYLLVGHNGSGKSTLIKSVLHFVQYEGSITNDFLVIGYVPEKFFFPNYMSIYEFLISLGLIRCVEKIELDKRIQYYLTYFEIEKYQHKRLNYLSKGMQQKVLIIQAFLHDAELYIFDEPLNGLDYVMQQKFIELIKLLKEQRKTIVITTHYFKYYENLYDEQIILEQGFKV